MESKHISTAEPTPAPDLDVSQLLGNASRPQACAEGPKVGLQPVIQNKYGEGVLATIAVVTVVKGLMFFGASFLDSKINILPKDPLTMLGVMYCIMGMEFLGVVYFHNNFCTRKTARPMQEVRAKCWVRKSSQEQRENGAETKSEADEKNNESSAFENVTSTLNRSGDQSGNWVEVDRETANTDGQADIDTMETKKVK